MPTQDSQPTQHNQPSLFKPHAIQLVALRVMELSIKVNPDIDDPQTQLVADGNFTLTTANSPYDAEEHKIGIRISAEIGKEQDKMPYSLSVELVGIFEVDESRFPIMHIEHWAKNNGPLVLYPYLREHVFGLTSRAGFQAALLPLFEIPTFKVSLSKA